MHAYTQILFKNSIKRPTVIYTPWTRRTRREWKKNAGYAYVCVRAHVYNFPLGIACRRLRAHLARETRPLGVLAKLAGTAGSAGRITDIIGPTSRVCVYVYTYSLYCARVLGCNIQGGLYASILTSPLFVMFYNGQCVFLNSGFQIF